MRTLIFTLFISILSFQCIQVNAQKGDERHERIRAMKVAYITEKLDLSTGEAEKFWPVYNDYEKEKSKIIHELRNLRKYYIENQDNMDDQEHLDLLEKFIKLQQQDSELLPSYQEKFIEVLPPKKVMKLFIAEIQFKNYLLQKLREHDGQGQGKRNNPE